MSQSPEQRFSTKEDVNGSSVTVAGGENGQAIVIHPSGHDFLALRYRAGVSFSDPSFEWPGMTQIRVEKVS